MGAALDSTLAEIGDEVRSAMGKFASFNSPHEGWAVIQEEADELWDEVKSNNGQTKDARTEAIQTAAMAVRYVLDLCEAL